MLAIALFAASASGAIAAPAVGAAGPAQGSYAADAEVDVQPDGPSAELGPPMSNVSDRRGSGWAGTAVVLLAANAMMLGVGAVLLWRRCVTADPEASP